MEIKEQLLDIYLHQFRQEMYLNECEKEVDVQLGALTPSKFMEILTDAHHHGYLGFHILPGEWSIGLLKKKIKVMLGIDKDYLDFRFCKSHMKMSVFINPYQLGCRPVQYSYLEDGSKITDFCYENQDLFKI